MIEDVKDNRTIQDIINQNDALDIDNEVLKNMMNETSNDHRFFMADKENDVVTAFLCATIETLDGEDVVFVQACSSKSSGTVQKMLDQLIVWGRNLGYKKIIFMTKRNPMAWERKYKFSKTYSVMQREI